MDAPAAVTPSMARFPEPEWFQALGRRMAAEGELFRRLGWVESRFAVRVLRDDGGALRTVGLELAGYALSRARDVDDLASFDPDFVIVGPGRVWQRMLEEIGRAGRPELRHTLNSLVLVGEELWLESADQLREDKFYRYNQTLQEFFNLARDAG